MLGSQSAGRPWAAGVIDHLRETGRKGEAPKDLPFRANGTSDAVGVPGLAKAVILHRFAPGTAVCGSAAGILALVLTGGALMAGLWAGALIAVSLGMILYRRFSAPDGTDDATPEGLAELVAWRRSQGFFALGLGLTLAAGAPLILPGLAPFDALAFTAILIVSAGAMALFSAADRLALLGAGLPGIIAATAVPALLGGALVPVLCLGVAGLLALGAALYLTHRLDGRPRKR